MVLKVVPLRSKSRNEFYDAILMINDKELLDEVDSAWEKMSSSGQENHREGINVTLLIRPRKRKSDVR